MIALDEIKTTVEEAAMADFKALFLHSAGGTEKNH
jgi:hypothetical protein